MATLLSIENLRVHYPGEHGPVRAVDGVSFDLRKGETFALVGESGCGKSATALSILRLIEPGQIVGGAVRFAGQDLVGLSEKQMRPYRGGKIGLVFQEAGAALNPVMRIGSQVAEALRIHRGMGRKEAWARSVELLRLVALPDPERQARSYPHELSGGMKQRVMLAIALSGGPELLIADEPTTALDVTIQAQILALLRDLKQRLDLTVLLITHDLGVVAENADRVGVMYAGRLVERSPVRELFERPQHPYTQALLYSMPGREKPSGGDRRLRTLPGAVPDPADPPPGCRFHPRCSQRLPECSTREPGEFGDGTDRSVACLLYDPSNRRPLGAASAGEIPDES